MDPQKMERLRQKFGRYVTPDVAERLFRMKLRAGGQAAQGSIIVVQAANFDRIASSLELKELWKAVNRYLGSVVACATKHGATVLRFDSGRRVTLLLGLPVGDPQPAKAIACARDLRRRLARFGQAEPALTFGIGVASGSTMAGNLGSGRRLEYALLGGAMLEAEQLAKLAVESGTGLLISETLARETAERFRFIPWKTRRNQPKAYAPAN